MSSMSVVSGEDAQRRSGRQERMSAAASAPLAQVYDISSAPSARRRAQALRMDDPASRRRPLVQGHLVSSSESVRTPTSVVARTVVLSVLSGLVAIAIGVGAGLSAQPAPYSGPTVVHHVSAGESLWGLAQGIESDRSLEQIVIDIETLNEITGGLMVGQEIVLPVH